MAITVIQQPSGFMPGTNDQWFTATSTQTAQPNFKFYITGTAFYFNGISYTSTVYTYALSNPPDSILRFNAKAIAEDFIKHFVSLTPGSGFQKCENGLVKVVVNIGEYYGATPAIYVGSNITYYAWNGVLSYLDYVNYATTDYVANNGAAFPILNSYPDQRVTTTSRAFLNVLAGGDNVVQKAVITSTDGVSSASGTIGNSFYLTGNWYDSYVALDVSVRTLKVLLGVNFIAVSGTSYTVKLYDNANVLRKTVTFNYTDICTKYHLYQLIYLNKKGGFDHFMFELDSSPSIDVTRTKVKHHPYYDPAATGAQSYTQYTPQVKTLNSSYGDKIKIKTDWLTTDQMVKLEDLITSPVIYLQDLEAPAPYNYTSTFPVDIDQASFEPKNDRRDKLFNLELTVKFSNLNPRQKGV